MSISAAVLLSFPNEVSCSSKRKPPPLRLSSPSANTLHAVWSPNFEPSAVAARIKYKESRAFEAMKEKYLNAHRLGFTIRRKAFNAAMNRKAQFANSRLKIASELSHSLEAATERARHQIDLKRFKAHDVSARVKYIKKFISSKNELSSQNAATSFYASLDAAARNREDSISKRRSKAEKFTSRHAMNVIKFRELEEMKTQSLANTLAAKMDHADKLAKAAMDEKIAKAKTDVGKVLAIAHAKHDDTKEKEKEINNKLSAALQRHEEAVVATKKKAASVWSHHVNTVASVNKAMMAATMTLAKNIEEKLHSAAERRARYIARSPNQKFFATN